jgi:hypothetical protein
MDLIKASMMEHIKYVLVLIFLYNKRQSQLKKITEITINVSLRLKLMSQGVIGTEGPDGHNRKLKVTSSWGKCPIFRKKDY